jgi:O-antigen ligase
MAARHLLAPRQYPLLYWTTLVYMVGVPNFIHFDVSGRTHSQGILNPTSISQIAIALIASYILGVTVLLERRPLMPRKLQLSLALWIPLLLIFVLATLLQPISRLTAYSPTDVVVSLYRLGEWLTAFGLIITLYSRSPKQEATALVVQMIGRVSWIWIFIVWTVLPIMPSQAYGTSDELASKVPQLGGQLIAPSYLATLTVAAFFYSLYFLPKGLKRALGCILCAVTIFLVHTRIEQISWLLLLLICAIFFSGKIPRLLAIASMIVALPVGVVFRDVLLQYFSRGQALKTLATLNDRTMVWQAAMEAARLRLLLGYGFVAGARNAIRDHWHHTNWIPPHAHNEYLQALLSGGILALILVVLIYGRTLWIGMRSAGRGHEQLFLFLLMVLFTIRSIGGSNLTIAFTRVGAVFMLTFVGIVAARSNTAPRKMELYTSAPPLQSAHEVTV